MTNDELAEFCGVADHPLREKFLANLTPTRRACIERMKQIEIEAALWVNGLGPKPTGGALLDTERDVEKHGAPRR